MMKWIPLTWAYQRVESCRSTRAIDAVQGRERGRGDLPGERLAAEHAAEATLFVREVDDFHGILQRCLKTCVTHIL